MISLAPAHVMSFTATLPVTYTITPFGAAVVEAMPDRAKVNRITRAFKRSGKCPTSAAYPTAESVAAHYRDNPDDL